jgi:hypothetical protein
MVTIAKCVRWTRNIDKLCVLYVEFHHTVEELLSCFSPPFRLLILCLPPPAITPEGHKKEKQIKVHKLLSTTSGSCFVN